MRHKLRALLAGAVVLAFGLLMMGILSAWPAAAHDSWINSGAYRGKGQAAGEWCCGEGDCEVVSAQHVTLPSLGYRIAKPSEFVPEAEAQPSPDGAYWRCKRPDGTRRCFFAPPEGF